MTRWIISSLGYGINLPPLHWTSLNNFLISKDFHSVQIQLMARAEKVKLGATVESNYHVLNGSTPLHLHPPLFFPCHYLLRSFYGHVWLPSGRWARERICYHRFFPPPMCCILMQAINALESIMHAWPRAKTVSTCVYFTGSPKSELHQICIM